MFGALTKGLSKIGNTVASGVGKVPGMGGLASGMKATMNRGIGPSTPSQGGMLSKVKQMGQQAGASPMQPPPPMSGGSIFGGNQGGMMGPMIERLMREQPPPPGWQPPPYDPTQATDQGPGAWGGWAEKQAALKAQQPMAPRPGFMGKMLGRRG